MKPLAPERVALLKAAKLLERDGWCQVSLSNKTGQKCAEGAIAAAGGYAADTAINLMRRYLGCCSVYVWNDTFGRTKDEVVSALRAAAVHGL